MTFLMPQKNSLNLYKTHTFLQALAIFVCNVSETSMNELRKHIYTRRHASVTFKV